jgi:N-acyl-L-homoserine lactone synthetase
VRVVQPHVVEDVFHGLLDRIPCSSEPIYFSRFLGSQVEKR